MGELSDTWVVPASDIELGVQPDYTRWDRPGSMVSTQQFPGEVTEFKKVGKGLAVRAGGQWHIINMGLFVPVGES